MKKLKIILLFSIIVFIYSFYTLKNDIYHSKYKNETKIVGYITSYKKTNSYILLEVKADEKILVKTKSNLNYKLGDYIKAYGKLETPSKNTNFNAFNYSNYLKSKKIYFIFNADKVYVVRRTNKFYFKIKNLVLTRIKKINNKYLYAFIVGDTNYLDNDIKESYRDNGTSHLFAVSGMHITLFSMILLKILSKFLKNKYIINFSVFSFLLFYMFLTNFTPSVIRATLLFIIININKLWNKKINPFWVLIFILDLLLLYNPFYVYNVGFVLSFLVSISLVLYGKISNNYHNYFIKLFMVSLVSFLISIPVVINNNNEINLLSPFINVIFVPLVSFIIFPLSLIVFIFPCFNFILNIFIKLLEFLSISFLNIRIVLVLKTISFLGILFYFMINIFVIKKLLIKKYRYLLLVLLVLLIHSNINYLRKDIMITMIDVDQGDSILISFPKNKNILIDTGGKVNSNYSYAINRIIPYLKSEGIKKIDYLILSHGDYDHMGESINLVNNFKIKKVIFNCGKFNSLEQKLIKILDKKRIEHDKCIEKINIDKNTLNFLKTKINNNENDDSNVIYTKLNNYKFMFMGDAGREKEKDILNDYNISSIDVLKVGHHGSKTSSSKYFINKINPKYSLISVGKKNRFGHPNEEALNNLKNSKIYRTDNDGSIKIKIKNNKLKIKICNS